VGFLVDKVALGQVFTEYFGVPCQSNSSGNVRLPESTDASSVFFDVTELDNIPAASIVNMLLINLRSNGFGDEFI
jgi:hypothetical protein